MSIKEKYFAVKVRCPCIYRWRPDAPTPWTLSPILPRATGESPIWKSGSNDQLEWQVIDAI